MDCIVNLDVEKELQGYRVVVPWKESRKALQKMAVTFEEKSFEDDARYADLRNLIADINERVREQEKYGSKD